MALVHDQRMAGDLGGEVPLVLAGHTHDAAEKRIAPREDDADEGDGGVEAGEGDEADDDVEGDGAAVSTTTTREDRGDADDADDVGDGSAEDETLLLIEGSTGGAGLRGLQGEEPEPLTASILYFDPDTRRLVAYDRITVGWLTDVGATIDRHIVGEAPDRTGR